MTTRSRSKPEQEIQDALSLASIAIVSLYAVIDGAGLGESLLELEGAGVVSAEQMYLYAMKVIKPINQAHGVGDVEF